MSPIEFETLCFLIFNRGKSHCSSFRGGILKDYDLRVINNGQFKDLPDKFWLQVKKKEEVEKRKKEESREHVLIYIGETKIKERLLGKEWIISIIKKDCGIKEWLIGLFKEYNEIFSLDKDFA